MNEYQSHNADISDRAAIRLLMNRMLQDPRLSSQNITLEIERGVLTVRGEVSSYTEKLAAQELAVDCQGVKRIINQLYVRGSADQATSQSYDEALDEALADRVREALRRRPELEHASIRVVCRNGSVSLSGRVDSQSQWEEADKATRIVVASNEVTNELVVDQANGPQEFEVAAGVEAALRREPGLSGVQIDFLIRDDQAILSGRAVSEEQRRLAEKIVERFGILHVRNDVTLQ